MSNWTKKLADRQVLDRGSDGWAQVHTFDGKKFICCEELVRDAAREMLDQPDVSQEFLQLEVHYVVAVDELSLPLAEQLARRLEYLVGCDDGSIQAIVLGSRVDWDDKNVVVCACSLTRDLQDNIARFSSAVHSAGGEVLEPWLAVCDLSVKDTSTPSAHRIVALTSQNREVASMVSATVGEKVTSVASKQSPGPRRIRSAVAAGKPVAALRKDPPFVSRHDQQPLFCGKPNGYEGARRH